MNGVMRGPRDWVQSRPGALVVAGLVSALAVPVLVALAVMHRPRWMPLGEVAQMEMRVRDVVSAHPPTLGLNGRFEALGQVGSHPGGLAFYALWPVYRLFGADGWGLMVSTVTLTFLAAALAVWIAYRRGGWQAAVGVTAVLAMLMRAYGVPMLAEPWNPHLPLVWWVTFLLAVWAVLAGDLVVLPVAVFAGSLAMQTHVPYAPLVVTSFVLLGLAGGWAVHRDRDTALSRRALAWIGGSAAFGAVLWLPPVLEQLTNDPGNMSILVESFRHPTDERVPLRLAFESWFAHLDLRELASGGLQSFGAVGPGLVFLAIWSAAVVVAVRRADREVTRLHLVLGVAAVAGLLATLRINGPLWSYLVLWGWGTTALMLFATVWTLWRAVPANRELAAAGAVAAGTVVAVVLLTVDAGRADMDGAALSRRLDHEAAATLDYLAGDPAGCGDSCRYQVTWTDNIYVGSEGAGLLLELERRGLDVGAGPAFATAVRGHRVIPEDSADAVVHVAVTQDAIDQARQQPDTVEIASFDLYSPEEHEANAELQAELAAALQAEGFDHLVELAASGVNGTVPTEDGMSYELKDLVLRANSVYRPSAVFFRAL